jgi:hypothetical protein
MTEFQYKLLKVRETKGAVLYQEVDSQNRSLDAYTGKVGNQYFRKTAFTGEIPTKITVKVQYE